MYIYTYIYLYTDLAPSLEVRTSSTRGRVADWEELIQTALSVLYGKSYSTPQYQKINHEQRN
jgi:hypothetical protein